MKRLTKEQFIERATEIYPKYNYSYFDYKNYKTKGKIICPKHGEFYKTPEKLLVVKEKCPKCNIEELLIDLQKIYPIGTDYRKEYLKLVKNNSSNGELHHILPKSMFPKWKNRKTNLVRLSFEDHYKAHYLLYKIYNNKEMTLALFFMLKTTGKKFNSELYEKLKIEQKQKQLKKVYCFEDDIVYSSVNEVLKNNKSINHALRKFSNTANKKHWCYLEDKEIAIKFWNNNILTNGRVVYCYELDKVFKTIKEASKFKKCPEAKIIKACKTLKNTSGKCHWCYLEDKEKALGIWKS